MENERWQEENDRRWRQNNERQYRHRLENERHEQEMQRRDYEEWQDWNDRQWLENRRHDDSLVQIEIDIVALFRI